MQAKRPTSKPIVFPGVISSPVYITTSYFASLSLFFTSHLALFYCLVKLNSVEFIQCTQQLLSNPVEGKGALKTF